MPKNLFDIIKRCKSNNKFDIDINDKFEKWPIRVFDDNTRKKPSWVPYDIYYYFVNKVFPDFHEMYMRHTEDTSKNVFDCYTKIEIPRDCEIESYKLYAEYTISSWEVLLGLKKNQLIYMYIIVNSKFCGWHRTASYMYVYLNSEQLKNLDKQMNDEFRTSRIYFDLFKDISIYHSLYHVLMTKKILYWCIYSQNSHGETVKCARLENSFSLNMKNYCAPIEARAKMTVKLTYNLAADVGFLEVMRSPSKFSRIRERGNLISKNIGNLNNFHLPFELSIIQAKLNRHKIKRNARHYSWFHNSVHDDLTNNYRFVNTVNYDAMMFHIRNHINRFIQSFYVKTYYNSRKKKFESVFSFEGDLNDDLIDFINTFFFGGGINDYLIIPQEFGPTRSILEYVFIEKCHTTKNGRALFVDIYKKNYYYRECNEGLINFDSEYIELMNGIFLNRFIKDASNRWNFETLVSMLYKNNCSRDNYDVTNSESASNGSFYNKYLSKFRTHPREGKPLIVFLNGGKCIPFRCQKLD